VSGDGSRIANDVTHGQALTIGLSVILEGHELPQETDRKGLGTHQNQLS
jgi:hypothetical protein